jgi:SAM-dependent methyltransferase
MKDHKTWIQEVFDKASPHYGEKGGSFFEFFGKRLVEVTSPKPGDHILDVATGKGAVLLPAVQAIASTGKAVGIDISSLMLQELKKKAPWADLQQMDGENLQFEDNSFDIVFCGFCLFFFPNPFKALQEFYRVLKPGGKLALSLWHKNSAPLDRWVVERAGSLGSQRTIGIHSISLDTLPGELLRIGFDHAHFHEESTIFSHGTKEEWWQSLWSHAVRGSLDQLSTQNLDILKKEALLKCSSATIEQEYRSIFALVKKSSPS